MFHRTVFMAMACVVLLGCGGDSKSSDPCGDSDADGDGVCDELDACPGYDDASDGDGDGVADGCDIAVTSISAGGYHTCALLETGQVRCWGDGSIGQLGYGATNNIGDNETPASAGDVDVGGTVIQLAAGYLQTCAVLDAGRVRCWGDGRVGQLGYGNTEIIGDDETPASVDDVDVGGIVVKLAAGGDHVCALLETGAVRCWGSGFYGQLGRGNKDTIGDDEAPASAGDVDVGGAAVQVVTGRDHTCVLLEAGQVRCWGFNDYGQLGYGNRTAIGDDEAPASAGDVDVGGVVTQLAAGGYHTCALLDTGAVRCWGGGLLGSLGYGNPNDVGDDETPASAGDVEVGGAVVAISAGGLHTCALLSTGRVRCWGPADIGQLGYGNTSNIGDDEVPASAGDIDIGGSVDELDAAENHTCALLGTGNVRCWGGAADGSLGHGNINNIGDDETPASAGDIAVAGP